MNRNAHVDFLRGIAILLVLLLHFALAYGLMNCPLRALIGIEALKAMFYNGNYGVTVFFVISGYLITSMSLARWSNPAHIDTRAFYTYRFARIMPALLLAVAIIVTLGLLNVPYFSNQHAGHPLPASYFFLAVLSILTFWHNVLMQIFGWFNYCLNIYWSLSVEEVFYLALPLVFLSLRRKSFIIFVCLALIIVGPVYRSLHTNDELFYECGYFACFDAIAMGCLTAMTTSQYKLHGIKAKVIRQIASISFVVIYLRGIDTHEVFGFSLIALCAALYLLSSVNDIRPSFATGSATALVRWFGRHSYELYLFHIVALALMRNVVDKQSLSTLAWFPWLILFITASALAAMLIAQFVSEPANRAIRRYRHV